MGPDELIENRVKNSLGSYTPVNMVIEQGEGEYGKSSSKKGGDEPYIVKKRKEIREKAEVQKSEGIEEIEEVTDLKNYISDNKGTPGLKDQSPKAGADNLKLKIMLVGCIIAMIIFRIILKFMKNDNKAGQN